jgi:hypothetical protein
MRKTENFGRVRISRDFCCQKSIRVHIALKYETPLPDIFHCFCYDEYKKYKKNKTNKSILLQQPTLRQAELCADLK